MLIFLQIKLDDALEEIVTKRTKRYYLGLCSCHPDLPCFHHRVSNLHFNLNRPRLLVWAQAIKAGTASFKKVLILSPMFKASLTLKHPSKNATMTDSNITFMLVNVPPSLQLSTSTQGQMLGPTMPFMNFPQYPLAMFPHMYALPPSL